MEGARTATERRTRHCLECGYRNLPWATHCAMCGQTMRHAPGGERPPWEPAPFTQHGPHPLLLLGIGALLAPVLALTPLLRFVGWFLTSLCHEIGHCVSSWLFGMPAYPAIRIDGHAAAIHSEQKLLLVIVAWGGLLWLTWCVRNRPGLRIACGAAVLMYPLLAFSSAHELIHLLAGHLGELAFAGVFLYRAFSGGFTDSPIERTLYAMLAWYLLGRNVILYVGLLASAAARAEYVGNGSFGLTQDFVRAMGELRWDLEGVAAVMLLFALAVVPLVYVVWRRFEGRLEQPVAPR